MEIDARDHDGTDRREYIAAALADLEPGAEVRVRAAADPWVALTQYRATGDPGLAWEYETEGPDEWVLAVHRGEADAAADRPEFDVRDLPPAQRHEVLLETVGALDAGQGFVLVNDHDPKPLSYELRSTFGDVFEWTYEREEPGEWRVAVEKTDSTDDGDGPVQATFDVREIPKEDRHPTIHHRFANVEPGQSIDVIAPHEPRPLRGEFEDRYAAFDWEVLADEPGRCQVRITKRDPDAEPTDAETADAGEDAADGLEVVRELDVRDLPPAQRHEEIFEQYADLALGEGFELVNDHDPKPLYYQFDAEAGEAFSWEYRQRDPGEFRVLIGKAEGGTADPDASPEPPF
ncbi:MAG: DUF2249 domain-containing protein [Haloarculaceae archaeon]